jgi:hypothetical protein
VAAATEWIEVNTPARNDDERTRLLLEVVDPLVHGQLGETVTTWFYFWEPGLRLRIGWSDPEQAERGRTEVARFLDAAKTEGKVEDWYEANHGALGQRYHGEPDFYGHEVWDLTAEDWMSGSELSLAIVRAEAEGTLTKPRDFHWTRRVHLFSNELWVDEITLSLKQAYAWLGMTDLTDRRVKKIRAAIEKYLSSS